MLGSNHLMLAALVTALCQQSAYLQLLISIVYRIITNFMAQYRGTLLFCY